MWSFNVARYLVREAGLNLVPERVPKLEPEMFSVAESYLQSSPPDTRCVIKVHRTINVSPSVKVIRNTRDLRDRLVSYFRFTKKNFDEQSILSEVAWSLKIDSHYDQWPADSILNISFDSIRNDSIELIRQIAEFIGLPVMDTRILRNIDVQFSKQQVRKQIAEIEDHVFDHEGNVKNSAESDAVLDLGPGLVRAFDVTSGFQSGHVSDYQAGDWMHLWTDEQKQMVDNAIYLVQQSKAKRQATDS